MAIKITNTQSATVQRLLKCCCNWDNGSAFYWMNLVPNAHPGTVSSANISKQRYFPVRRSCTKKSPNRTEETHENTTRQIHPWC